MKKVRMSPLTTTIMALPLQRLESVVRRTLAADSGYVKYAGDCSGVHTHSTGLSAIV